MHHFNAKNTIKFPIISNRKNLILQNYILIHIITRPTPKNFKIIFTKYKYKKKRKKSFLHKIYAKNPFEYPLKGLKSEKIFAKCKTNNKFVIFIKISEKNFCFRWEKVPEKNQNCRNCKIGSYYLDQNQKKKPFFFENCI